MNPDIKPLHDRRVARSTLKGRAVDSAALSEIQRLLGTEPRRRDLLIEYLHRIQDSFGCLSAAHLAALAAETRLSMAEVYEVATFYHHFDVVKEQDHPPAKLTIRVCETLSCAMAGASDLLDKLPTLLGSEIRVIPVPCVGRCEQAPVAVVGRNAIPQATTEKIETAVREQAIETPVPEYVDYSRYRNEGGYQTWLDLLQNRLGAEEAIVALEHAGLRGLGGAGFPVGRKWRIVRYEPAPRLLAVNIDEGEPGTFKDRWYLERDPHRFLEGMLIAATVVGISEIYIYLRDEYAHCRELLARELARLQADPPGPLPPIVLRRGAGAYICGEESAMIESLEGKRGVPRLRPPYVAQVGLFGRPTLEHNFETLYWVRDILERGSDWFASHGRHGRKGLRSFSVSGRVNKPGVYLAPAGITVRELIDEYAGGMPPGHELYGYLPGGASGGILPAELGDLPLDFDTLNDYGCFIGSAAVIVLSQQDKAINAARNMMHFFAEESCGQCTPCRVGTAKAVGLMQSSRWDTALLEELSQAMADASICGLGQAAPNVIRCIIKYFPHELS